MILSKQDQRTLRNLRFVLEGLIGRRTVGELEEAVGDAARILRQSTFGTLDEAHEYFDYAISRISNMERGKISVQQDYIAHLAVLAVGSNPTLFRQKYFRDPLLKMLNKLVKRAAARRDESWLATYQ